MKYILFHGAFGNPDENWLPMLASKLREVGQTVVVPAFPVDDWDQMVKNGPSVELKHQNLDNWLTAFAPIAASIDPKEKLCFVGHSLGCVFILHAVEKYHLNLDSAIFVSPFLDSLDRWEFNLANHTFYKTGFDFDDLNTRIPTSYVIYGDDDPYVPKKRIDEFGKAMKSNSIVIRAGGHLGEASRIKDFGLVYHLCVSRIPLAQYVQ